MKIKPQKSPSTLVNDRMIHIRLDVETHKYLKVQAAQTDSSIQRIVENLIFQNIAKPQGKKSRK